MITPLDGHEIFDPSRAIPHETLISAETLAAIGMLITTAASAEIALVYIMAGCISNDEPTRANIVPLVAGQNISVKLGVLRTIFRTRTKDYEKGIRAIGRLQKCFDVRNLFAHGIIAVKKTTPEGHISVTELKIEGEKREWSKPKILSPKQILAYGREIAFRVRELESEIRRQGATPSILKRES